MQKKFVEYVFLCAVAFTCETTLGAAGGGGRQNVKESDFSEDASGKVRKPVRLQDEFGHVREIDVRGVLESTERKRSQWQEEYAVLQAYLGSVLPGQKEEKEYKKCVRRIVLLKELLDNAQTNIDFLNRLPQRF